MNTDWVFWGAIGAVAGSVILLAFLAFKIKGLMARDAERRKE